VIDMVGSGRREVVSSWGKRIVAVLGTACALAAWSCSSGSPDTPGNGSIPPPLNQPCDKDSDCGSSLKCDPLRGCLPCVFDWHCAKGERCTDDGCKVPVACKTDANCSDKPKAPHCDPVIGECVGCRVEADCKDKSHCVERSCVSYTPCVNSRDCAEGTVCNRDAGECVECLGNGDCVKDKEVCVATHCVPVCTSDKDCADRNQLCHHDKGYCADCVEQEDCPSIYYCDHDQCKLDICKPGTSECQGKSGFRTCNKDGSGYDASFCPVSTTCTDLNGAALCKPWICTPGTSDCDAKGETVQQCALDGLSIASETDCSADGQRCYMAQCKPQACEPGSQFCKGAEQRECVANGTDSTVKLTCSTGTYCDESTQGDVTTLSCISQKCTPSASICDGSRATRCDTVGSGPVSDGTDCSKDGRLCVAGECRDVICSGTFCKGNEVWSCSEGGTVAKLSNTCSSTSYCLSGSCYVKSCTGGQSICNGTTATTCKADGSGAEAGGTDCAATDQACVSGSCVPKVCSPSSYFCSNGNPQACNSSGTAFSQTATCSASYFCKAGYSSCQYDVCTAGQTLCNGTIAGTCAADGSGPADGGTDCAADNKVCYSGTCLPKICNPNEYFCQGGNSYLCGSTGATSTLNDTCLASEFCKAGNYYCQADVCTAGAAVCNGTNLSTCATDGSGPADAGTACSSGSVCYSGACKPVVCTPDALQCSGNTVQRCINNGTQWSTIQTCDASSFCNEAASPIACAPDTCTASGNACNGEKLATCAADGGHFTATSTDCAASNTVCTLAGTCAAEAADTVGSTSYTQQYSSMLVGNIYRADRSRTLTKIEEYFSVSGTSVFTWVVYEATSGGGTYTKVFEKTASNTASAAFVSSGTLSVPLVAGRYYVLGVIIQGNFTLYATSTSAAPFVSFGQLMSGTLNYYTSAPTSISLSTYSLNLNQRISTTR
jgi:hypothetical protein